MADKRTGALISRFIELIIFFPSFPVFRSILERNEVTFCDLFPILWLVHKNETTTVNSKSKTMNAITSTIGRILYALPFGIFGLFHFMNAGQMKGMVPLPPQIVWVYVTGAGMLLACISILINKKAKLGALLLGIMLLIFALSIHLPNAVGGDQASVSNLLKDVALAGGALLYSGIAKD